MGTVSIFSRASERANQKRTSFLNGLGESISPATLVETELTSIASHR
jgi:hypothetical protein